MAPDSSIPRECVQLTASQSAVYEPPSPAISKHQTMTKLDASSSLQNDVQYAGYDNAQEDCNPTPQLGYCPQTGSCTHECFSDWRTGPARSLHSAAQQLLLPSLSSCSDHRTIQSHHLLCLPLHAGNLHLLYHTKLFCKACKSACQRPKHRQLPQHRTLLLTLDNLTKGGEQLPSGGRQPCHPLAHDGEPSLITGNGVSVAQSLTE